MKIVYITPHLSTGGMPEYLRKKIEILKDSHEIWVLELSHEKNYTTIRDKIEKLIKNNLISLENNYKKMIHLIEKISPDVIHFEEMSDHHLPQGVLDKIYKKDRSWKIFETLHDSSIDWREKRFIPDKMLVVSMWQVKNFLPLDIPIEIIQHEIIPGTRDRESGLKKLGLDPKKKHILQVGLFSSRKNQRETFELARMVPEFEFHFVGGLTDNYKYYWEELVSNKPHNCTIWGERNDVNLFYSSVDGVIFPSQGRYGDTETNPLAIKEAIAWQIPLFLKNIPVYMNMYPESNLIKFMTDDRDKNCKILRDMITPTGEYTIIKPSFFEKELFDIDFDIKTNKITISYLEDPAMDIGVCVRDLDTEVPIYSFSTTFENKSSSWVIPLPKDYYDFYENTNFSGFLIDFYNPFGKIIKSKTYRIKDILVKKKKFRIDTFEPVFVNFEQFFTDRIYDPFLDQIEDLDFVLDIGSSVGLFTELVRRRGAKHITAFEVSQRAIQIFKNLHQNTPGVMLVEKGVWSGNDLIKIYEDPENSIVSSAIGGGDYYFEVETISLDSFFHENGIEKVSLMKMDIEGSEYKAFDGLSDENLFKIENIILEFHDNTDDILQNQIINRLSSLGFDYQVYQEDCRTKTSPKTDQKGVVFFSKESSREIIISPKQTSQEMPDKTLVIIDCYVSSSRVKLRLIDQIERFKTKGFKVALISNTTIEQDIQNMVDFFFFDKRNQLFEKKYPKTDDIIINDYVFSGDKWEFTLKNHNSGVQRHGLSVLVNFHNSVSLAKSLGFENIIRIETDYLYGKKSMDWIFDTALKMENTDKKALLFFNDYENDEDQTNEKNNISFHLMFWNVDFFLDMIPKIKNEKDYENLLHYRWSTTEFLTVEQLFRNILDQENPHTILTLDGQNMTEYFPDTVWNTEASLSNFEGNFENFFYDIYRIENGDGFMFFSRNLTKVSHKIMFKVFYSNGQDETFYQDLPDYQESWCWNIVPGNLDRWQIYYDGKLMKTGNSTKVKNLVELSKN